MRDHPEEHPQSENRLDMLAQLKAVEGDTARHRLAYDRARANFANFAFLDHSIEWLRSAVGTKRKLSRVKVEQIGSDVNLRAALDAARQRISEIALQVDAIRNAPRDPKEAGKDMVAALRSIAQAGAPRIDLRRDGDPARLHEAVFSGTTGGTEGAIAFLVWCFASEIEAKLLAAMPSDAVAERKFGFAALDQARAALLAAERAEEAILCAMEAEGVSVFRRIDVDPRAVLELV
ncbi:hypothetical protein [Aliihoeflea sp. 40Bstr573]|uniref:hypothetical protein n=1 Tax=Aliihoeflea sp. 40Bstr573 TaxID=2696467 RepID=UPI0020962C61|nr:hypothetical protein [Aliihoeflea sp. 40Bstr573]MCO6387939.1 hypothetical protein [Aliihoeflea sp. 40Bstr573]